jgi:hypothetical protein
MQAFIGPAYFLSVYKKISVGKKIPAENYRNLNTPPLSPTDISTWAPR